MFSTTRQGSNNNNNGNDNIIVCLVRPDKVSYEQSYWNAHLMDMQQSMQHTTDSCIKVMPYDMLDNGETLNDALEAAIASSSSKTCPICIYHIASVFGPTEDPIQTAEENVQSTEDTVLELIDFLTVDDTEVNAGNTVYAGGNLTVDSLSLSFNL